MLGQSALAGYIAGQIAGGLCKLFDADEDTKRSVQMVACSVVGNATAVATFDIAGWVLTNAQAASYMVAKEPSSEIVTASVTVLTAISGQPQPHHISHLSHHALQLLSSRS